MSENLQQIERALVTSQWSPGTPSSSACRPAILSLAEKVANGDFRGVLISPECRTIFTIACDHDVFFDQPLSTWFSLEFESTEYDEAEKELLLLIVGIACLHAFIQVNWTGPDLDVQPSSIIQPHQAAPSNDFNISENSLNQKAVIELAYGGEPAYHLAKVTAFLRFAQIIFALPYKTLQSPPWWRLRTTIIHQCVLDESVAVPDSVLSSVEPLFSTFASTPALAGRLALEQGLLEHRLGNNKPALQLFHKAIEYTGLEHEVTGVLGKRTKFQIDSLSQLVLLAESRLPDDNEGDGVTEADGKKTVGISVNDFDTKVTETTSQQNGSTTEHIDGASSVVPETLALNDDTLLERTTFNSSSPTDNQESQHAGPRLSHIDPNSQPPLHPLDQCILLALCLNVRNTSPAHGLTNEQMSPYVERVILHPRNWSVHTMALLLRSRLESTRSRTVERSTLQLQALVDQMPTADAPTHTRLLYIHTLPLPSKWSLERELAKRFLSLGVVRSAMEIFERLEMWEQVVQCWQVMERPDKAIAIIRDLLEGRKEEADTTIVHARAVVRDQLPASKHRKIYDTTREAKLWCLLGDMEPENAVEHYGRAWRVSNETSGRAMRSLGAYYFVRNDYKEAIVCLKKAVAMSPLQTRSWFMLGCACSREEEWQVAREAFGRCVALDDEDAESWNNLASVYLKMGEVGKVLNEGGKLEEIDPEVEAEADADATKKLDTNTPPRIPHQNKVLAFRALKQGLKFSYENWRMWTNYMLVAVDIGEMAEACRALGRIVEERAAKDGVECVDEDVLDILAGAVIRGIKSSKAKTSEREVVVQTDLLSLDDASEVVEDEVEEEDPDSKWDETAADVNPNEGVLLLPRVLDLLERTILTRVSSPRIFSAYARLLASQSRYSEALKAYLDAYRASIIIFTNAKKGEVSSTTTEDSAASQEKWREAVDEVEHIVGVLKKFGPLANAEADRKRAEDGETEGEKGTGFGGKWEGRARSIVRTFMNRTRENFEDQQEWNRLVALMDELSSASSGRKEIYDE